MGSFVVAVAEPLVPTLARARPQAPGRTTTFMESWRGFYGLIRPAFTSARISSRSASASRSNSSSEMPSPRRASSSASASSRSTCSIYSGSASSAHGIGSSFGVSHESIHALTASSGTESPAFSWASPLSTPPTSGSAPGFIGRSAVIAASRPGRLTLLPNMGSIRCSWKPLCFVYKRLPDSSVACLRNRRGGP